MTRFTRQLLFSALAAAFLLVAAVGDASTYRSTGTTASNADSSALVPGAPAGKAIGDLLLLHTGNRAISVAIAALTGWTQLCATNVSDGSIELWARIADGGANDTPSPDWTGTNDSYAWIEAYSSHSYTDLGTIIQDACVYESGASTELLISARTVASNNALLVALTQKNKTAISNDATTVTMPSGLTKRTQLIMSGAAVAASSAATQQTTATNFGGSNATIDGTAESLSSTGLIVALKTTAVAPTWDTQANVQSQSTTAYTLQYDADANAANIYCAAFPIGTAEQTGAAIEAGTGAHGTATEATTGASDTLVLTPTDSPAFPAYELQCVLKGTGGYSAIIVSLPNEFLDPPTGKLFQTLASVHADSPCFGATPAVVAGDILVIDDRARTVAATYDPAGYVITPFDTCLFSIASGGDQSRRFVVLNVFDVSLAAYYGEVTDPINNQGPGAEGAIFEDPLLFEIDVLFAAIDLRTLVTDPEGDTVVATALDALPAGTSVVASVFDDTGAGPTACGENIVDVQWADPYGGTLVEAATIQVGTTIPNVADTTEAATITAIETTAPCDLDAVAGAPVHHQTIAVGKVVSTSPAIGQLVPFDQVVSYSLSLGPSLGRRTHISLGLGN